MAQAPTPRIAPTINNVCTIQVGTTGTIGSLMTWELESMKQHVNKPAATPPPSQGSTPRLKNQSPPISVPCGATPTRTQRMRSLANVPSSSRTTTAFIGSRRNSSSGDAAAVQEILAHDGPPKTPRKNGAGSLLSNVLSSAGRMDREGTKERLEKKRHSFLVEVVDLKCNNPMNSRLKKLGFSKLSETIA